MTYLLKMAFRDLARNRRRSFFSALALGIGLALLLLIAGMVQGEMESAMETSIKLQSGHLQVSIQSYDANKSSLKWEDLIENPAAVAVQIAALSPVKLATPRLIASGIVAEGDQSLGVQIMGVDPASPANAPFTDSLVSGKFITADDRDGIYIGASLANKLGLQAGSQINLLTNTSNGDTDTQPFTVRGIFSTRTPSFDQSIVLIPLAKAQAFARAENHASIIYILLNDRNQTDAVVSALQSNKAYQVKTYVQMNELLVTTEQLANSYMGLLYLIVLAITATVIVNTLIMSVFERTREIGILSAIGMRSGRIMSMFFAESAILAVGGIVLGLVIGALLVTYFTQVGFYIGDLGLASNLALGERIYAHLTMSDTIGLTLMAFIVTLVAALYPALLAARMEPVAAMRGGK